MSNVHKKDLLSRTLLSVDLGVIMIWPIEDCGVLCRDMVDIWCGRCGILSVVDFHNVFT